MTLSEYEKKEWDRLQQRKADALSKKARHLLPTAARDRVSAAVDAVRHTPGVDVAVEAYADATTGLGKIIGGAASHTVSTESVVKQFQKAGYEITTLGNIHHLDLEAVDSVAGLTRVRWSHAATSSRQLSARCRCRAGSCRPPGAGPAAASPAPPAVPRSGRRLWTTRRPWPIPTPTLPSLGDPTIARCSLPRHPDEPVNMR